MCVLVADIHLRALAEVVPSGTCTRACGDDVGTALPDAFTRMLTVLEVHG